jgi:cytochrome c peroxidase
MKRIVPLSVQGGHRTLSTRTLHNLAWENHFFWDRRAISLRQQVLMPVQEHDEMDETLDPSEPTYPPLFAKAFGPPKISAEKIAFALE